MLWSATVTKKQPFPFDAAFDLQITSAVLGNFTRKNNERVVLSLNHVDFVAEEHRTVPLAVFSGQTEFVNLNLVADEGEPISFIVDGPENAVVHLAGFYIVPEEHDDSDEDELDHLRDSILEDSEDDEEFDPNDMSMDSADLSDEDSDDNDNVKVEVLEDVSDNILERVKQKINQSKKRENPVASAPEAKKAKTEQSPKKQEATPKKQETTPKKQETTPKKQEATPKKQEATPKKQEATPKKQETTPKKETPKKPVTPKASFSPAQLRGGLKIEVLKPSSQTTVAKKGNKITVKYTGRLASNKKVFDSGKFTFALGKKAVIQGWDQGLENMPVGETRKLIIPPNLAYGKTDMAGIPANSTLEFEVTLLSVKA